MSGSTSVQMTGRVLSVFIPVGCEYDMVFIMVPFICNGSIHKSTIELDVQQPVCEAKTREWVGQRYSYSTCPTDSSERVNEGKIQVLKVSTEQRVGEAKI